MKYLIIFISGIIYSSAGMAQVSVLEDYIQRALQSNLALQQKEFSLQKSSASLREARGMFLPSLEINARYSRAGGGREIEFPVGDLVNPAYETLNQLLQASGQPPRPFPVLQNEIIPFLREKEHETKLRLVQPLFQPAIYFNYQIKSELETIARIDRDRFKRLLVEQVKQAYFNFLKTDHLTTLLDQTGTLLEENLRVSQSLFKNGKVTADVLYTARAELSAIQQETLELQNQKTRARYYFNFLLNKALDDEIRSIPPEQLTFLPVPAYDEARDMALRQREELMQLEHAASATRNLSRLEGGKYLPTVNGVVDYGFQGETYDFSEDNDYWMASLLLQWNLFNGLQDQARREQSEIEIRKLETQKKEVTRQIEIEVRQAVDRMRLEMRKSEVAADRLSSSRQSYKLIDKKYSQGMVAHIEYLNARTRLTEAEINHIITRFDYQIAVAVYERIAAVYGFNKEEKI